MQITERDALLVIDVQNDFVSGSLAIAGADAVIEPINRLAQQFAHVIVATDWHPAGHVSFASRYPGRQHGERIEAEYGEQMLCHDHCVQGTFGAELDARLELTKAELILRKGYRKEVDSFGAFYENDQATTGLGSYLRTRGFERVFCTGLARYGCVMQSALGAARDGFATHLLRDASAGDFDVDANNARLAGAGVVWIDSTELT